MSDTQPETKLTEEQEKIDFFLITAHELRTSLSAMKWMFKMFLDGDFGQLTEDQATMIKQANTSNDHMVQLINDTMVVVQTDGASIPYAMLPVSLNALLPDIINEFTNEASHRGMHLRYTPPVNPIPINPIIVNGDEGKLRIVLHNLLENAIKYGNADTDVTITLATTDTTATISIADHGIPIPEEEKSHVFQKFFRTTNAKKSFVGVGLGLYATKYIIERHGGTLTFTSSAEEGTVFTITLPL